ncbi:MAG TPA: hypothetical protein VLF95_01260 [Vicinamibacteria bacterium]|nr:hypothetical protein [Vicinamibacteria bacterium]
MSDERRVGPGRLILVPAVITLAVTLLRLVGELQGWSPRFFSREAGGGGALVGISWLVPVFGAWFGWKLAVAGEGPASLWRALGLTVLAIAALPVSGLVAAGLGLKEVSLATLGVYALVSVAALVLAMRAWPALGRTLLAYGLAARVPVILVMLGAILGSWGTHYDAMPPGTPEASGLQKWLFAGVLPQLTIWQWFTVAVGGLFGIAAAAAARRRRTA